MVAMHEDEQRPCVLVLHDEGFYDVVLVDTELARGFRRASVVGIVVKMFGVVDVVSAKKAGRKGLQRVFFASHSAV
jgi:hypothetical protein